MPLPLVLLGLTSGIKLLGNLIGAAANKSAMEEKADQERRYARMLDIEALDTRVEGERQAGEVRQRGNRLVSEQKASYGNSGVGVEHAQYRNTLTTTMSEMDARTVSNNGYRKAFGLGQKAADARERAKAIHRQANIQLGTSILGMAASGVKAFGGAGGFDSLFGGDTPPGIG